MPAAPAGILRKLGKLASGKRKRRPQARKRPATAKKGRRKGSRKAR